MSARTADGLAYEVAGSGPGVLLSHAGIADRRMWDPQWAAWRDRFTVIRYDLRGFGESADPGGAYTMHDDALAVLDAAGIDCAAVVGASMAGEAVLDLALAEPERVWALVLVNATAAGWEHTAEHMAQVEQVFAAYEQDGVEAANEAVLRMWVDGAGRETAAVDPGFRELVAGMNHGVLVREQDRERAGVEIEPAALDPPALRRFATMSAPVLVVTGAHDQPSQLVGADAIAAGTGAETAQIAGAAHLPSLEHPDQFERVVLPFLERHAQSGDAPA